MGKEYFKCAVVTKKGINIKEIEELLGRNTWTDPEVDNSIIPARKIEYTTKHTFHNRITHCNLTRKEAQKLRQDPRILGVDILIETPNEEEYTLTANYNSYLTSSTGNPAIYYINNVGKGNIDALNQYYTSGSEDVTESSKLTINRYGENVDILINDSQNINWSLPDFYDDRGNNRASKGFQTMADSIINYHTNFPWGDQTFNALGIPTLSDADNDIHLFHKAYMENNIFYGHKNNFGGASHSTGVASTCAGSKFGIAKKANIIPAPGLSDDLLVTFHVSKSINTKTQRRNPTISVRSVGGSSFPTSRFVITGSLVSASFDLNFMEAGTGFRINYAGHDIVFTSGSSTTISTPYLAKRKLGAYIYEYSCLNPRTFVEKINNAGMATGANIRYSLNDFDNPLSMFSASYSSATKIFSLTSSFGLPSNVRIYTGTLAQLTGSEAPSGGHFKVKLTGSSDPSWAIKDWAPNGTPLGLNGVDTYPKNEYGLHIRPYDQHGIENESIYPWSAVWTDGSVGLQAGTTEDTLEFRLSSATDLANDEEMSDKGIILVNSAGNKSIDEYKSSSVSDTYYRTEYNVPSSHPYHSYYVAGRDENVISEDDRVYYHRHHNHVSVIEAGNFEINLSTSKIRLHGVRGNSVDIFAPGHLNIAQYANINTSLNPGYFATSSIFNSTSSYNNDNLFLELNKYTPLTASAGLLSLTQSIDSRFLSLNTLVSSASGQSSTYYNNFCISGSDEPLDTRLSSLNHHKLISFFAGTSAACPLVGGLLALYLEVNPTASVIDCKDYLRNTARVNNAIDEFKPSVDFSYVQDRQFSASISNGLVIEHDLYTENGESLNILNGAPNRILYNAEFNTAYRDVMKLKSGLVFKGGFTYKGNTNKFNLG